jgi:hypothetical protein
MRRSESEIASGSVDRSRGLSAIPSTLCGPVRGKVEQGFHQLLGDRELFATFCGREHPFDMHGLVLITSTRTSFVAGREMVCWRVGGRSMGSR